MKGPAETATHLLQLHPSSAPPERLEKLIQKVIEDRQWAANATEAQELAETWKNRVKGRLTREITALNEIGRPARIAFNSSDDDYIQGSCFEEPKDPDKVKEAKRARACSDELYACLQDLEPGEFEILCGRLLTLFKIQDPTVTRASADEGVDFFGRLQLESVFYPGDLSPTIQRQLSIWIVGQAKRYIKSQAGTPEIRDLLGAVQLARGKTFSGSVSPHRDLDMRIADPFFALLITAGQFSSAAWKLLERSGVIGIDGETLSAFLADRSVGAVDGSFDKGEVRRWLSEAA